MPTPDKDTQNTEAMQRTPQQIAADAELSAGALDVAGDDAGGDAADTAAPVIAAEPVPEPAPKPINRNSMRDEIAKNFRRGRQQETDDAREDMEEIRALTNNGLPQEFQDGVGDTDVADVVEAVQQQRPAPRQQEPVQPQKIKVKVNGQEQELTQEEIIAAAQKSLAGDDYLGRAKKEAKDLIDSVRTEIQGLRTAAPPVQNQSGDGTAQEGADGTTGTADENHVDPALAAIEKLQFGNPAEAASSLRQLINDAGRAASKEELALQRRQLEHTRSMSQLRQFTDANPDLARDEDVQAVMRVNIFKLQREDLIKAGVDEKNIPTNPEQMATVHLDLRSLGADVRTVPQILATAKSNFEGKWRGGTQPSREAPGQQQQQQSAVPAKATVEVNVNRTQRREAITQQPTRTMSPRPDPRPQERRDGSSVVQQMKASRQAPRQGRSTSLPA